MNHISLYPDLTKNVLEIFVAKARTLEGERFSLPFTAPKEPDALIAETFGVFARDKNLWPANLNLILPDTFVTVDILNLPNLGKSRLSEMVKPEFEKLYNMHNELIYEIIPFSIDKNQASYLCSIVQKKLINQIYKGLNQLKPAAKTVTFAANALTQALYIFKPAAKKTVAAICDFGQGIDAAVSVRGMPVGGLHLPLNLTGLNESGGRLTPFRSGNKDNPDFSEIAGNDFVTALCYLDGALKKLDAKYKLALKNVYFSLPASGRRLLSEIKRLETHYNYEYLDISATPYPAASENLTLAGGIFAAGSNKEFLF